MAARGGPVVVCNYPTRDDTDEVVAELRKAGIATVAVPSDQHAGAWDVLVPSRDADRVNTVVETLVTSR